MDTDSDHGGHERVMLFCMDHKAVQAIIIQDPVVDPFRCRTLVINLFIGFCSTWDIGVQTDIPFGSGLDDLAYLEEVQLFLHLPQWSFPKGHRHMR